MKIQKTKNFMKKLLGLFFFILFLFSISTKVKASDSVEKLNLKDPDKDNALYNLKVIQYNEFLDRWTKEGFSCKPAASPFFIDFADCLHGFKKIFRETIGTNSGQQYWI